MEAALLTSPKPLKIGELARLFAHRYTKDRITQELGKLAEFWQNRGLRLVEVGDGWRFQTIPEIANYLVRLVEEKAPKYSRAGWIEVIGHRESPGRPALFATTPQFLNDLGLKSLSALPPLKGETPQAQEFELDFSDEKIRENLGKDAAPASLLRSEATTASEKNELKRTAVETAEVTNDDEESKA